MKGIFVVIDGLGDLECRQFGGKTPLEVAHTPNLDLLATRGDMGYMYPVSPGYIPRCDEAMVSMFGNDLKDSSGGQLEARGLGVELKNGDLALRVDFGAIDSYREGNIIDGRVSRNLTTREAGELAKAIDKIDFPYKFEFVLTSQRSAVLVIRGNFSNAITCNDIVCKRGSFGETTKIDSFRALGRDKKAEHTAEVVNEFLKLAYGVLMNHPVNLARKKKGFLPANYLFAGSPGVKKPKLKQYKNWISTHSTPLEIGFSDISGMKNFGFKYPEFRGLDSYKNLWNGLRKGVKHSVKIIRKNLNKTDYVYVYFKETDFPGCDNKPIEKKEMIEYLDKTFFKFVVKFASCNKVKVLVTGDHSTPCKLKAHSDDPVPVLLYNFQIPKERKFFGEKESRKGSLKRIIGKDLIKKIGFH